MNKVNNEVVNYMCLVPGIYVQRKTIVGGKFVTNIDIRVKRPNFEECMSPQIAHTVEELGNLYIENDDALKDYVICFGPMACMTSFLFVVKGNFDYNEDKKTYMALVGKIMDMFRFIVNYKKELPNNTSLTNANCQLNDLLGAQWLAANMLVMYEDFDMLMYEYPTPEGCPSISMSRKFNEHIERMKPYRVSDYISDDEIAEIKKRVADKFEEYHTVYAPKEKIDLTPTKTIDSSIVTEVKTSKRKKKVVTTVESFELF